MIIICLFLSTFLLVGAPVLATNPEVSINISCNGDSVCNNSDLDSAVATANNMEAVMKNKFDELIGLGRDNQTEHCQSEVQSFKEVCNPVKYQYFSESILAVKKTIETKSSQITSASRFAKIEANDYATDPKSIEKIIANIEDLIKVIDAGKEFINKTQNELLNLDQDCSKFSEKVEMVCQEPTAATSNGELKVYEYHNGQSKISRTAPARSVTNIGAVVAEVNLSVETTIDAPKIIEERSSAANFYHGTSRISGATAATLKETDTFANNSLNQASLTLDSLKSLVVLVPESKTLNTDATACTGAMKARNQCGDSISSIESSNESQFTTRPQARPSGAENSGQQAGSNSGGQSAEQIMQQANSSAYGSEIGGNTESPGGLNINTSNSANGLSDGSANGPANGSANGSSGGGFMQGLGALGGMAALGKTIKGNNEYGSSGSSNSIDRSPNPNLNERGNSRRNRAYDPTGQVNSSNRNNNAGDSLPTTRGFQQQNSAGSNFRSSGDGGGSSNGQDRGGSGLSGMNNNSGGSNNNVQKPGLLSRIFGKKDKTFLGKTISGKGGASSKGSSNSGSRLGSATYDRNGKMIYSAENQQQGRTFDPDKYMPSKAAQDRAYARSTGRKIASFSGANNNPGIQWPKDISKNKDASMFSKVTVTHRMSINNE